MRKLIGTIAIVGFLALYVLIAFVAAIKLELYSAGKFVAFAYYVVAGLAWVAPVAYIIWWMEQSPPDS